MRNWSERRNQKEQCLGCITGGVAYTSFDGFCSMQPNIIKLKNHLVMSFWIFWPWWFRSSAPTKCKTWASTREYSALPSMLMLDWANWSFLTRGFRSGSNFHRQGRLFFFSSDLKKRLYTSLAFNSYGTQCRSFRIISYASSAEMPGCDTPTNSASSSGICYKPSFNGPSNSVPWKVFSTIQRLQCQNRQF